MMAPTFSARTLPVSLSPTWIFPIRRVIPSLSPIRIAASPAPTRLYRWPGVDCNGANMWYWSSAANNNHLKFGGVSQTNGAAYFSCLFHVDQGSALSQGTFDIVAGFTSGDSVNGAANVDSWN